MGPAKGSPLAIDEIRDAFTKASHEDPRRLVPCLQKLHVCEHFHLHSTPALLMLLFGFCGCLRVHNVALHLWVLSPLVPSDASTIVETLARSMEAAISQFRSLGKAVPKQTLVWAPWLFHKAVFAYVSAIHP